MYKFVAVFMNMPAPQASFTFANNALHNAMQEVCEESMKAEAKQAVFGNAGAEDCVFFDLSSPG